MSFDEALNAPMLTSDAAAMLRCNISKNERPYTATVMKMNNRKVDAWKKTVLDKMGANNQIPALRVWESWRLYDEGTTITQFQKLRELGMIPDISPEVIEFWKTLFETSSVEELHAYGAGTVAAGWNIVQTHIKSWFVQKKWDDLFSLDENPLFWEKNYHSHVPLLRGEVFPFWDKETFMDIHEKIHAVISIQVKPE